MKHIGLIIVLLGALALIIPFFLNCETNTTLAVGAVLIVAGAIVHGIVMKKGIDNDVAK